jgi:hypothetical protein
VTVYAEVSNWLVVQSRLLDVPVRAGEIVEVPHRDGSPPYVVRWQGEERTSVVFPGPDAVVSMGPPSRLHPAHGV